VFNNNEMVYGTHARYNLGYGHCETIVGSKGTGS
jgi:phage major head subunit gpT-like protein